MLSRLRAAILVIALSACASDEAAAPAVAEPSSPPGPSAESASSVAASATWLSADAFADGQVRVDLPAAPSGRTTLFLVPATDSRDWRRNDPSVASKTDIVIEVQAIDEASASPGKPLPAITNIAAKALASPKPTPAPPSALPEQRTFQVWSQVDKKYVAVGAKRASVGSQYAFYEDVTNGETFTADEYATMHEVLAKNLPSSVSTFGAPTDIDGNGHIVVLFSRTVATQHPSGEAHVDMCTLTSTSAAPCSGQGEVAFLWSLDALLEQSSKRSYWVSDWFPRTILHETIHLLQYAEGFRKVGHVEAASTPAYLREGAAEVMRYVTGLGGEEGWKRIAESMARGTTPFEEPYFLGGLHAYFLQRRFGEGVHQRMNEAFLSPKDDRDLVSDVTGVDEPLALAWMWAAIHFDETAFGASTGLELPGEDVTKRNLPLEPIELRPGEETKTSIAYTGRAIVAVDHMKPVRVTLKVARGRAPVMLVARP